MILKNTKIKRFLVDTSNDDNKYIFENMEFLLNEYENTDLLADYTNKMLKNTLVDKYSISTKLVEFIENNNYALYYKFDQFELYKFLRNSLSDFNKEEYYKLIYTILANNYNCYLEYKKLEDLNYNFIIFPAINESSMSNNNKTQMKKRILRNLQYCMFEIYEVTDEKYLFKLKYKFDIFKYIIDTKDFELFEKYIQLFNVESKKDTTTLDVYMASFIYLYYLIEAEEEKYVSFDDKETYKIMLDDLKKQCDLESVTCEKYYFEHFELFLSNLEIISSEWEKFNFDLTVDVKTCLVSSVINIAKKSMYLMFGGGFLKRNYKINEATINLFKQDFEEGNLKEQQLIEIKNFLTFVGYEITNDDIQVFEKDYLDYIVENYKPIEIEKTIDVNELNKKLQSELISLKDSFTEHSIFNKQSSKNIEVYKCSFTINKDNFEGFYKDKNLLSQLNLEKRIEGFIYDIIIENIDNKIYYRYDEENKILEQLKSSKGKQFYFRPKNDQFGEKWKFGEKYNKIISKFKNIDTNITNKRLLITKYKCNFENMILEISEITDNYIENEIKKHFVSRNKNCVKNEKGLDIFYSKKEFIQYLKNTTVIVTIKVKIGIEIYGNNNVAFIWRYK